jgi:hypothetical protein
MISSALLSQVYGCRKLELATRRAIGRRNRSFPTVAGALAVFERDGFAREATHRIEQKTCGSLAVFGP